jgi:O-antigen/teichoic acid export membrane protein
MTEQKISGKGAHYILIAKLFFTLMGILIVLWGLPFVFGTDQDLYFEYNLILAKISLINMLLITGSIQAVSRFIAQGKIPQRILIFGVYKLQAGLCALIGIIFFLTAPYLLDTKFNNLITPLRISGLIPVFYGFYAINIGVLNGNKRFKLQAAFDISFAFLRFMIIVGGSFLAVRHGILQVLFPEQTNLSPLLVPYTGWATLAFSFAIISFIIIYPSRKKNLSLQKGGDVLLDFTAKHKFPVRKFLQFATAIILFNFFFYGLVQMDILCLEFLLNINNIPEDYKAGILRYTTEPIIDWETRVIKNYLGLYTLPLQIARLSFIFVTSVGLVMFPNVSSLDKMEDREQRKQTIENSLRFSILILILLSIGIITCGPHLLKIIPGNYAQSDGPSFVQLLSISQVLLSFFNISLILTMSSGHPYYAAIISLLIVILNVASNYFFIPVFGAFGTIYSALICLFVGIILSVFFLSIRLRITPPVKTALKCLLAFGISFIIIYFLPGFSSPLSFGKEIVALMVKGIIVLFIYFLVLIVIKEIKKDEIQSMLLFLGLKKS